MNIAEILKNAPKGTKLYSIVHGEVTFQSVDLSAGLYPISVWVNGLGIVSLTEHGYYLYSMPGSEPILFPSKEQRDWTKFRVDLPVGTPVAIFDSADKPFSATVRRYSGNGRYVMSCGDTSTYPNIVPFDKIKIKDGKFIFDEKDNYGTCGKEANNGN